MPRPLVTIVTVFHNRGTEVERSVNSLLAQTYTPLEIIVVDDGSTDDTPLRLRSFNDPRLKVQIQPNQGFTRAIDAAVRSAKGEFVAIHGAGDVSLPQRIERQAAVLVEQPHVGVVGCFIENETGRRTGRADADATGRALTFSEMRRFFPLSHGEAMFRKVAFQGVGGYRAFFTYAQDHDLWLRMSRDLAFWVVPELLYVRRSFENSVATNPVKLMFQSYFVEFAEQCARAWEPDKGDLLDQHGQAAIFMLEPSQALAQKLNRIGLMQLVDGDEAKGRMILAASRPQSGELRIILGSMLGRLSKNHPRLWKSVLRPFLRPIILKAISKAAAPARPNVITTMQPKSGHAELPIEGRPSVKAQAAS